MFSVQVIDVDFDSNAQLLDEMYRQRYAVYCSEYGFIRANEETDMEVDEYDTNRSCAYFLIHENGYLAASSRLIINDHHLTLPIIAEGFEIEETFHENSAEISRFIINKEKRNHPKHFYTTMLGYHMYTYVKDKEIEHIYALMEEEIFNFIRDSIGCEFRRIGKPRQFMGGVLVPARLKVSEVSVFG